MRDVDSLIIGGGPGGLTTAIYLARFRRSAAVIDAGESRLRLIPRSRNIPGFPDGVTGLDLLARLQTHARVYGADLIEGSVTACEWDGTAFTAQTTAGQFRARTVVLATGVDLTSPAMADLDVAIARGKIRYCPVCDGYEAIGSRIGVLGGRPGSIEEAHFLLTYSDDVTYVPVQGGVALTHDQSVRAREAGIVVENDACVGLALRDDALALRLASGLERAFDTVYPCLGSRPRSELAESLGAQLSEEGELITDQRQATNIPGLFAVGDVLRGLDQIASACGQAAIAATAAHNHLRASEEARS